MLVRCIKRYNDLQLNRMVQVNEEYEVDDARGKVLILNAVAEELPPPTSEVVKRKSKKKTEVK